MRGTGSATEPEAGAISNDGSGDACRALVADRAVVLESSTRFAHSLGASFGKRYQTGPPVSSTRFELLVELYGDEATNRIFSEAGLVQSWLDVEVALVATQAELGIAAAEAAEAIARVACLENVDLPALWSDARIVGYPILPLVRQIEGHLPAGCGGWMHFGATTQDIMDTGLVLQLKAATARLDMLLVSFGDGLAALASKHTSTVIAARTHAQLAVPTVLGAKFAVYVAELARHRVRLADAAKEASELSLFGAGGTSAAYGKEAPALRAGVAARLKLRPAAVPWHVARDQIAHLAIVVAAVAATATRFAREVIDLSRNEIGELAEMEGYLRGASSTMPQKHNPISSEAVIGLAVTAAALSAGMLRAMEAGHERAAGEWQIEWQVLPQLFCLCAAALATVGSLVEGLNIFPERMQHNIVADGSLILAEAYMMQLAANLGREVAHELVYKASRCARDTSRRLVDVLREISPPEARSALLEEIAPESYLGQPELVVAAALEKWRDSAEYASAQAAQ